MLRNVTGGGYIAGQEFRARCVLISRKFGLSLVGACADTIEPGRSRSPLAAKSSRSSASNIVTTSRLEEAFRGREAQSEWPQQKNCPQIWGPM
jgi:hypothetical protein